MAKVIIEILHSGHARSEYKQFDSDIVRIGRGFFNDVILPDPYVSAEHIVIQTTEDGWIIKDNKSKNGMFVKKFSRYVNEAYITSGDEILIGKTHIRIFSPSYCVVPAKPLSSKKSFLHAINNKVNVWYSIIGLLILYTGEAFLSSKETSPAFGKLFMLGVMVLFLSFSSAGFWALIGRIVKHKPRFLLNLTISNFFYILVLPLLNIASWGAYLLSKQSIEIILFAVLIGGLFALVFVWHLAVATTLPLGKRIFISHMITVVIVSIGMLLHFAFKDDFDPVPMRHTTLKPPFTKMIKSKSIDVFLDDNMKIFTRDKKTKFRIVPIKNDSQ